MASEDMSTSGVCFGAFCITFFQSEPFEVGLVLRSPGEPFHLSETIQDVDQAEEFFVQVHGLRQRSYLVLHGREMEFPSPNQKAPVLRQTLRGTMTSWLEEKESLA
jgi:hypothetical protein